MPRLPPSHDYTLYSGGFDLLAVSKEHPFGIEVRGRAIRPPRSYAITRPPQTTRKKIPIPIVTKSTADIDESNKPRLPKTSSSVPNHWEPHPKHLIGLSRAPSQATPENKASRRTSSSRTTTPPGTLPSLNGSSCTLYSRDKVSKKTTKVTSTNCLPSMSSHSSGFTSSTPDSIEKLTSSDKLPSLSPTSSCCSYSPDFSSGSSSGIEKKTPPATLPPVSSCGSYSSDFTARTSSTTISGTSCYGDLDTDAYPDPSYVYSSDFSSETQSSRSLYSADFESLSTVELSSITVSSRGSSGASGDSRTLTPASTISEEVFPVRTPTPEVTKLMHWRTAKHGNTHDHSKYRPTRHHMVYSLMQKGRNSNASAMELRLLYINLSVCYVFECIDFFVQV